MKSANNESSTDTIPWPSLAKLSPSNLRRTATNFLDEWEKSLAPLPGSPDAGTPPSRVLANNTADVSCGSVSGGGTAGAGIG